MSNNLDTKTREQSLTWVLIKKPKGIFLIIVFYLMLASFWVNYAVASIAMFFPGRPGQVYENILSNDFFSSGILGTASFMVCYCLLNKKQWSHRYTRIISAITLVATLMALGGAIYAFHNTWTANPSNINILPSYRDKASMAITAIDSLTISVVMIYILRYLNKPEVKAWFESPQKEETHESSSL
jgi:hypothetical protein